MFVSTIYVSFWLYRENAFQFFFQGNGPVHYRRSYLPTASSYNEDDENELRSISAGRGN